MRALLCPCVFVLLLLTPRTSASAAVIYDELFDGDLGGEAAGARVLELSLGSNKVRTATGPRDVDRMDVYEVALPPGAKLERITIDGYDPGLAGNTTGFTLLTSDDVNVGGVLIQTGDAGREVLTNFAFFIPTTGLRFAVVESDVRAELQVDYVVTPIPAAAGLLATALGALAAARWRRLHRGGAHVG